MTACTVKGCPALRPLTHTAAVLPSTVVTNKHNQNGDKCEVQIWDDLLTFSQWQLWHSCDVKIQRRSQPICRPGRVSYLLPLVLSEVLVKWGVPSGVVLCPPAKKRGVEGQVLVASAEGGQIEAPKVQGCPLCSRLEGLEERHKRSPGQISGRKRFLAYFEGHRMLLFAPIC